jgi:Nse1 non-SMC component of SMC5-6 complex
LNIAKGGPARFPPAHFFRRRLFSLEQWMALLISSCSKTIIHSFIHSSFNSLIMAEALTTGQKTFNQMLLADHCWTEKKALKTWNDLAQSGYDMGGDDLHTTLASCNAQLEYCGLEITAICFMNNNNNKPSRHYAMINKYHGDDIAKSANKSRMTLSEINLSRLIFEKLVQDGQADRATLINLKKDLTIVEASFTLEKAHAVVQALQDEKFIKEVETVAPAAATGDDDDEDEEENGSSSQQQRRQQRRTSKPGTMRASMALAPRAFMELGYLFVEQFGMDKSELPQQLYFR